MDINYINISLDPNDQNYAKDRIKLTTIIKDFEDYSDINVDILIKSLYSDFKTNYTVAYINEDYILTVGIMLYIINDTDCQIEYIESKQDQIINEMISKLDKLCIKNNYNIRFTKSLFNIDKLKKQYYEIIKNHALQTS